MVFPSVKDQYLQQPVYPNMTNKVLVLFAHPRFEQSRTNRILVNAIPDNPHITLNDLYELYPDYNIDIQREKELLLAHDIIIWHHPLYWYSSPPLLKQWIDMVLEFGWAYGPGGDALTGKLVFNVFSSGGPRKVYQSGERNHYTIQEFFRPFEQTVRLCHMEYLPPFGVQGTHRLTDADLKQKCWAYSTLLNRLVKGEFTLDTLRQYDFLNDWLEATKSTSS
jgi:glutathione-regulated potassium-efflux system ancillary protein KefG